MNKFPNVLITDEDKAITAALKELKIQR